MWPLSVPRPVSHDWVCSVQKELGTYPQPIQAVMQKLLEAASPSAQVPLHWRYSLMSLAVFLFITPPVDAASAKVGAFSKPLLSCPNISAG